MKVCPNCQFVANDNEMYCVKCGTLLPETTPAAPQQPQADPQQPQVGAPQSAPVPPYYAPYQAPAPVYEDVSLGKWILYYLIPYIPFVGPLVFIVMLFVWGFGKDKNPTFRNWARAMLIFYAAALVFVMLIVILCFAVAGITPVDFATEFGPSY